MNPFKLQQVQHIESFNSDTTDARPVCYEAAEEDLAV